MQLELAGAETTLGRMVSEALAERRTPSGGQRVLLNLSLQPPNTLLHDGHRWRRFPPTRILTLTRSAIRQASSSRSFLVHASYVLAGARDAGVPLGDRLQPFVDAALEAEDMVLRSAVPASVVRLGYLYGPELRDLRAYRRAFRIGRPYWAGPDTVKQRHLHTHDAVRALLAAASRRSPGRVLAAADNQPVSFAAFMDHFARLSGNPLPLHLPAIMRPLSHAVVAEVHMQMVEAPTAAVPGTPRPAGFAPLYPTYRSGLRQVVDAW